MQFKVYSGALPNGRNGKYLIWFQAVLYYKILRCIYSSSYIYNEYSDIKKEGNSNNLVTCNTRDWEQ